MAKVEMVWVSNKKQNLFVGSKTHKIEKGDLISDEVLKGLEELKADPKANGMIQISKEAFEADKKTSN